MPDQDLRIGDHQTRTEKESSRRNIPRHLDLVGEQLFRRLNDGGGSLSSDVSAKGAEHDLAVVAGNVRLCDPGFALCVKSG